MKKKTIYKLISLCLTLLMAVSAFIPVKVLSSTDTTSVTISGIDSNYGAIVTAYKLIDVNLDGNGNPMDPAYKWNEDVADWLRNNGYDEYVVSDTDDNVTGTFEDLEDNGTAIKTLVDKLASAIRGGRLTVTPQTPVEVGIGNDSANYTLGMGAYLFLVSDGVKIYAPGFARVYPVYDKGSWSVAGDDININAKSNEPSIAKSMNNNALTLAIGEEVTYTLTVEVPQYSDNVAENKKAFKIYDILPSGLTFNDNVIIEAQVEDEKINITDCFDESTETGKTFVYTAKYDELKAEIGDVTKITLTYTATVNNTAYATETLLNKAFLTYDVNPYETADDLKTKNDTVQSYTYGLEIIKQVDTVGDLVNGTQFTLSDDSGEMKFTKGNDGYYYLNGKGSPTLEVDANGKIWIKGLDLGTYTLKETKAPNGYAVPSGVTTIVLADTNYDGILDPGANATKAEGSNIKIENNQPVAGIDDANKNQFDLTIMNYKNDFNLPTTGGMGTMIFTVGGILLMGGAVILMVFVLRKKKEQ